MGNSTSRSGTQDPEVTPFFFEQSSSRRTPKRYKKTPDELPDELKYAHLGPRVAAFLATKDKEKLDGTQEFDDGLGSKSLLPDINKKVSLIRHRLDSLLSSEQDLQRKQFKESCSNGLGILIQLSRVLYLWEGLQPPLPRSLEFNLTCNFPELIGEIYVFPRDWQLPSNKEEYLTKSLTAKEGAQKEDGRNSVLSKSTDDDLDKTGRETKESESRMSRSKSKIMSRASTMADITEGEESRRKDLSRPASRQGAEGSRSVSKRDLSNVKDKGETPKPKTRLEKYKSGMHLADSKVGTDSRKGIRNLESALGESSTDNSKALGGGAKDVGYWAVINFQLSSKICDDLGWIIHPSGKEDPERETLLEWATQRLQQSIKQKKDQAAEAAEQGLDKPNIIRHYGDSRREQIEKYKGGTAHSAYSIRNNPVFKGDKPSVPSVDFSKNKNKKLFMVTTADGSTTVFYPSGLPAIVTCRTGGSSKSPTFYTMVYDNTPQQNMLACFTPWGHCCCYHDNGRVRLLTDKEGGTLADVEGVIQKRWNWPNINQKLPVSIVFQLNSSITLRCLNINQMQLIYNHEKESAKVHVGVASLEQEPPSREEMGHLVTGLNFSSQAAKEFSKPYRPKAHSQKSKTKGVRGKFLKRIVPSPNSELREQEKRAATAKAELEKLLDFTEPTENDADADKELYKLQRKVKNIVEDWLEHYRIAIGISSPYLKGVQDHPSAKRTRNIRSAKPGGGIVIIEKESTMIPRPKVSIRAPSAPVGRVTDRPQTTSTVRSDRPTLEHRESCVKFSENPHEIEPDTYSVARSTTLGPESSVGSAQSHTSRVQSAPQTMTAPSGDLNPSIGLCPVALRMALLGHQRVLCRCSRHKVPFVTDVELDDFIKKHAPERQLVVIAVTSSLSTHEHPAEELLETLYDEKHRNRSRPCMQSRNDPFRVFWYDLATAADLSDHSQPLLLRRHNVVMGMFLIYESGKLLFCDHIFNGYGNARKDFHKQLQNSRRAAANNQSLPQDFKFSPQKGRHGMRSAWGGEIGGLIGHKDRFITKGGEGEPRRGSDSSLSSSNSKDLPIDYHISGVDFSMSRLISRSLTEAAISDRQSPRPGYPIIRPMSQPVHETLSDLSRSGTPEMERSHSSQAMMAARNGGFTQLPGIKSSA